jgi:DNA-binding NtrC family response regulator
VGRHQAGSDEERTDASPARHINEGTTSPSAGVIASTRRDPDKDVQSGRLRDDLFDRLAVTRIELAPLRKRRGDVPRLAEHFWRVLTGDATSLPGDFLALYEGYDWPGNVRELENSVVRRLTARDGGDLRGAKTDSGAIESASASPTVAHSLTTHDPLDFELPLPRARQRVVEAFEREYVARVLARHGGNIGRAAAASGIARRYFQLIRARLSR